jgi:AmmeMemoRadiSam system protein A
MDFSLTEREKQILLNTVRESIRARLFGTKMEMPPTTPTLQQKSGAFVTLHKKGKLRGCIGYVLAYKSLIDTVREMAEAAAFNDPRFPALSPEELKDLHIEISVLSPLQTIHKPDEIHVGVHGIIIHQGSRSGLLLPQVATEYNWDRETFLNQTCRKAGLPGDCWKQPGTKIEIFSAVIFDENNKDRHA